MRKILIIIGLLVSLTGYGQTVVNSRVMLDTLNGMRTNAIELSDYAMMQADTLTKYVTLSQLVDSLLVGGGGGLSAGAVATQINDTIVARLNAAIAGVRVSDTAAMLAPYINKADTAGMLTNYINKADTAGMLSPYFTLTEIRKVNSDTIPIFVFGGGAGLTADTAFFNNGALAGSFYNSGSDTLHITSLRGVLKEGTGTETIDVGVKWHATFLDAGAGHLNNTDLTITSITTGTVDATFDHNDIPPGVFVWCTLSGASKDNKPTHLCLTMTGYKQNRSY